MDWTNKIIYSCRLLPLKIKTVFFIYARWLQSFEINVTRSQTNHGTKSEIDSVTSPKFYHCIQFKWVQMYNNFTTILFEFLSLRSYGHDCTHTTTNGIIGWTLGTLYRIQKSLLFKTLEKKKLKIHTTFSIIHINVPTTTMWWWWWRCLHGFFELSLSLCIGE